MRLRFVLAIPLLLPFAVLAETPVTAIDWLNRMSEASRELNYEGTFIYGNGSRMQTMQLFHANDGKDVRDRLVTLDGRAREVVRKDGMVICILPDHKAVFMEEAGRNSPLPFNVPTRIDQLESFYEPKVAGDDRVAGQPAQKIVIAPRDHYRYGQTLWLDRESGLLVKAELQNEAGEVLEQLVFTRLKVHDAPLPEAMLEAQGGKGLVPEQSSQPPETLESRWVVTRLPAGFHEKSRRTRKFPGVSVPVEHRLFTDGLASVSVFIEPLTTSGTQPRNMRRGALNAYTRFVDQGKVTVLGDVPAVTVRFIGDGVMADEKGRPE